jgi:CDP-6-deoxy-D-xylo-4-hexulose-3-dehydrase
MSMLLLPMPPKLLRLYNYPKRQNTQNLLGSGFPITVKPNSPVTRLELLTHLDQHKIGSRLLFAGNLTRQPYMIGANFRISGELTHTDNVMNNTFWIGVQPALTKEMLDFVAQKIKSFLSINI